MLFKLASFTGIWLTAAGWAQNEGTPNPADIAETAMKAMDALSMPVQDPSPPTAKTEPERKRAKKPQAGVLSKPENADEEPSAPPLLPPASSEGGPGMDPMSRARLDMMVPSGRSHRGVYYPMFRPVEIDRTVEDATLGGAAGVSAPLASLFESDVVTRLDDDHVQFDRAKWIQYQETTPAGGPLKPSMSLEIERGVYDLKNAILMTNQPVKIENDQFTITGDSMLHDRASGLTRLTGRVRMTFYNEEPAPAASPVGALPLTQTPATASDPAPANPSKP